MRFGTRTLKVTAWLSAATFAASMSCIVCNICDLDFGVESENYGVTVWAGALHFVHDNSDHYGNVPEGGWCASAFEVSTSSDQIVECQLPVVGAGYVIIPLWLPVACSLAIGVPAFVTLRRRARAIKDGACPKCGYRLTGLSPAAPCPECGRVTR